MTERPLIFVVDDESEALAGMLDALTRRFGGDYRVMPHLSPGAALAAVRKSAKDGDEIALVIADQRMPEMTGREFLGRVRSIVPTAKRALVVAWGDREASPTILQACALGELDNYLYKPWAPAEIHLYPLIGEFLAEWTRSHRPGMELPSTRNCRSQIATLMSHLRGGGQFTPPALPAAQSGGSLGIDRQSRSLS